MTTGFIISKASIFGITLHHRAALKTTEADIETNLGKAEALRQAILKKAFAGERVPRSPADEPASALLAPLRTARAAAPARKPFAQSRPTLKYLTRSDIK